MANFRISCLCELFTRSMPLFVKPIKHHILYKPTTQTPHIKLWQYIGKITILEIIEGKNNRSFNMKYIIIQNE